MTTSIKEFLLNHGAKGPVSFHMPGHKGSAIYKETGHADFLEAAMDCDITEITGADNLFQPEGIIRESMNRYKTIYGSEESYLLVNGSSGGLIASILATVEKGGKLVMARNCHKSVFNALGLGNIQPVYAYPETVEEYGILGAGSAEEIARCLDENPDASAVILPSPNYYGICSDVKSIAEEVHKRGKVLIIDQAHGAHLKGFESFGYDDMPLPAESQGADLVINSIHKTLASFTQTALLNVCSSRVDRFLIEDKLQTIESSSPSYLMMASLDINADILEKHGERLFKEWHENIEYFYNEAAEIKGLHVMKDKNLDFTKLNLDMSQLGIDGNKLEELLMEKGIFVELVTGNILMCMTGIGNKRCDFERLIAALKGISESHELQETAVEPPQALTKKLEMGRIPERKCFVGIWEAEGRVCASSIIPYPPGIPIVCPGEVIDKDVIEYISRMRALGGKVIGISGDGKIAVSLE